MSSLLTHPLYNGKALEDQWINSIFTNHDLFCGCNKPIRHLLTILNRKGKAPKPEPEIKNIECLITGEKDGDPEDEPFGEGELELLFQEDGDEENTADTATG